MKKQAHERDQWLGELEVLRKAQQLNQLILDNTRDLITIHKLADLSYEYVNPATLKVLGVFPKRTIAQSPLDLIHPDDIHRIMKRLKEDLHRGRGRINFVTLEERNLRIP